MTLKAKRRSSQIPFGLPRIVVTAAYFIALCITGMAIQAADPLQELMKLNGAYSEIENEKDRSAAIASVVGFGLSFAVLSGVFVGPVFDLVGAKITALIGLALHSCGYIFMFLTDIKVLYYVSGICFGTGFQFILNSHLSVGCLFPNNVSTVLSIIAAGPDLSLFMPTTILSFAKHFGGPEGVRTSVIQYLIIFVTAAALIDLFLLPLLPYKATSDDDDDEEGVQVALTKNADDVEDGLSEDAITEEESLSGPLYSTYTLGQQLATLDFWIYCLMFVMTFCRKKHFSLLVRPILSEMDPDPSHATANFYANMYNQVVPIGFIPGILWGALVDRFGIIPLLYVSNTLGLLYSITSMIPYMPIQIVTITIYILYQSFVFGQAMAFISSTFGFTTIANLLGISSTVVGIASIFMDFVWVKFINNTLGSYRMANLVWVIVSIIMYILPMTLSFLRSRRPEDLSHLNLDDDDDDGLLDTILPMAACYDRASLGLLGKKASQVRNRLKSF